MIFIEIDNELQQHHKERIANILTKYGLKQIDNYCIIKNGQYKLLENQILKEFGNIIVTNRTRRNIKFISMTNKRLPEKYLTRVEAYHVFATKQDLKLLEINILELLKIGLTPLYKKLDIELPKLFVN
jgi:hypothetical protein